MNSPHLIHSTQRGFVFWLPSTLTVLLLSVFLLPASLPDSLSARENAKISHSNHKPLLHSRRIPVDARRPFMLTWKVVIAKKMLSKDSPVCHETYREPMSPLRESPPPHCRSRAGMRLLSKHRVWPGQVRNRGASGSNHATCPYTILGRKIGHARRCFSLVVHVASAIFFVKFHRKLVVTCQTRNQAICFVTRQPSRIRHVD